MANFYLVYHITFENTNALFLNKSKADQYVIDQVNKGYGTLNKWRIKKLEEGQIFEAEILEEGENCGQIKKE